MAADDRGGFANPLPIVLLLLFAAGVLVKTVPLQSARPAEPDRKGTRQPGWQDVPARLWEDPFAAVERAAAEPAVVRDGGRPLKPSKLAQQFAELGKDTRVIVLPVMVFGGTYAEDAEHRRRYRYAVVAGLGTGRASFEPDHSLAIGYIATHQDVAPRERLPKIIPYEWFTRTERDPLQGGPERGRADAARQKVLVLWLQEEVFTGHMMRKLRSLVRETLCAPAERPCARGTKENPLRIIGPAGSSTLKALVSELHKNAPDDEQIYVRFYSASATMADYRLRGPAESATNDAIAEGDTFIPGAWRQHVQLLRAIGTDDLLIDALIKELALRNVNPQRAEGEKNHTEACRDALAIVSEWDTAYARELKSEVRQQMKAHCPIGATPVRSFSYLRGLDGALSAAGPASGDTGNGQERTGKAGDDGLFAATIARERVDGGGQFDYLRRIGDQIAIFDREQRTGGQGNGVRAIGVLGSDVYDKLLVLQALRPRFPDAIFFTTDLDVRLVHPDQSKWARNLVVASNFGLALNEGLQRFVPPFRDAYQTAAFLATRIAVMPIDDQPNQAVLDGWLKGKKKVYEIGRTRPVELDRHGARPQDRCEHLAADRCENVQALRERNYPPIDEAWRKSRAWLSGAALAAVFLALLTSWNVHAVLSTGWRKEWGRRLVALSGFGAAGFFAWEFWRGLTRSIDQGVGEPFLWMEGVSLWPTELLRLAAAVISVVLLWRGWLALQQTFRRLTDEFCLPTPSTRTEPHSWRARIHAALLGPLRPFSVAETAALTVSRYDGRPKINVSNLWRQYLQRHMPRTMWPWIVLTSLVFATLGHALEDLRPSSVSYRGEFLQTVDSWLLHLVLLLFIILVMAIVCVTRNCTEFIRRLSPCQSEWPAETIAKYTRITGLPCEQLDHWIDFALIGELTKLVNRFTYFPFVVLLLLVIAQSDFFDAVPVPPSLIVIGAVLLAYSGYCAISLRRAAEQGRALILRHYENTLLEHLGDPTVLERELGDKSPVVYTRAALATQIKHVIERIRATKEGAFLPLSQQPFMRALLIPLGGYGGVSLIDWLAMASG